MIVCLCRRISDRDIERAVAHGARDFEQLQDDTCIARNCACCEDCAREVFDRALERHTRPSRLLQIEEPALA
jgi:bacterioferritin-associated ferredoxin